MSARQQDQKTVCELTPGGRGAICVLQVDSPDGVKTATRFLRPYGKQNSAVDRLPIDRPIYGHWGGAGNDALAEDIVLIIRSEHLFEIHCHGGEFAKRRIIADLKSSGCRLIRWPESIRITATCDEANRTLPLATTTKTAAILNRQAKGALDREIRLIVAAIESLDLTRARDKLQNLLSWREFGLHLVNPWRVAIAGRPNVGKSSLINRIIGYERAIVFDQPGTTRDLVTAQTAIQGWPVELIDTAGLRHGKEDIERSGIERARESIRQADLVIAVFDHQTIESDRQTRELNHDNLLCVFNKSDLARLVKTSSLEGTFSVSALTGDGIDELLNGIACRLVPKEPGRNQAIPFLQSHFDVLEKADQLLQDKNNTDAGTVLSNLADR